MACHVKCGKVRRHITKQPHLVSKVITRTLNLELLTVICCAIYTIKCVYRSHKNCH